MTILCMRDETTNGKIIQETKNLMYKYESPLIFIDKCTIKLNEFQGLYDFYFEADKTSMRFLEQKFGVKIKRLIFSKDKFFPTPIHLNTGLISYKQFENMFIKNEIIIRQVNTKIQIFNYCDYNVLRNKLIDVWCD